MSIARALSIKRPQKESWRVVRLGVMYAICSNFSEVKPIISRYKAWLYGSSRIAVAQ